MNNGVTNQFPFLTLIMSTLYTIFFITFLWIFGRMGDNINKIRKMLENELLKKNNKL